MPGRKKQKMKSMKMESKSDSNSPSQDSENCSTNFGYDDHYDDVTAPQFRDKEQVIYFAARVHLTYTFLKLMRSMRKQTTQSNPKVSLANLDGFHRAGVHLTYTSLKWVTAV